MPYSSIATGVPTFGTVTKSTWQTVHASFDNVRNDSQGTGTLSNLVCLCNDNSTRSVRSIKYIVLAFKNSHGLIWPIILTIQKWYSTFHLLQQDWLVVCRCSIVAGGLCIIVIMISYVWDQTSVNYQFNDTYYQYDIWTKHWIKYHTKNILNLITDTISNLQVTLHPLQSYLYQLISYFQYWWCWWYCCCCCCCHCRGCAGCCWRWETHPEVEQLRIAY